MSRVDNEINGRLALITGASGGIGAACARALWAEGASLALTCHKNRQPVDDLVKELLSSSPSPAQGAEKDRKISVHTVDTGSVPDIERLFRDLRQEHPTHEGPDILVSNAGYGKRIPDILDISVDEFDYTLNVNLRASFVLAKLSVPWMQKNGWGRIVFVSSIAAIGGGINGCHYAASKAGLTGMMKNLAAKQAQFGITVNDVAPAMIGDTGLIPDAKMVEGTPGDVKNIPVGRLGTPQECANVVLMLSTLQKAITEIVFFWTTLITNNAYLSGLLTLDFSLKQQKSKYPLVALYTDTFPESGLAALKARGVPAQRIEYLLPTQGKDYSNDPRFYDCWSKLTPFSLAQYKRVVQLDSDMLVLRNMDELMEMDLDSPADVEKGVGQRVFAAGHACVCNPLKKPHYPKDWVKDNCAFTHQHPDPDKAQTEGIDPSVGPLGFMNGGLQVVNPSKAVFKQIVEYMENNAVNMDFADQSVLSDLYRGRWVPLPYIYNALKTMRWAGVHDAIWKDESVKNVHYILAPKPWDEMDEQGNFMGKDESHSWWVRVNNDRLRWESEKGVYKDGF
ncbi:glycosyl transferase family protein [Seiridium cupressi]